MRQIIISDEEYDHIAALKISWKLFKQKRGKNPNCLRDKDFITMRDREKMIDILFKMLTKANAVTYMSNKM